MMVRFVACVGLFTLAVTPAKAWCSGQIYERAPEFVDLAGTLLHLYYARTAMSGAVCA
jgi:hypothetical protein